MTRRPAIRLDDLPDFASDTEIGAALLGPGRACEWQRLAPLYERRGFPKVDPVMGGRYVRAVRAFFDREYSLTSIVPSAPDGVEDPAGWTSGGRKCRA